MKHLPVALPHFVGPFPSLHIPMHLREKTISLGPYIPLAFSKNPLPLPPFLLKRQDLLSKKSWAPQDVCVCLSSPPYLPSPIPNPLFSWAKEPLSHPAQGPRPAGLVLADEDVDLGHAGLQHVLGSGLAVLLFEVPPNGRLVSEAHIAVGAAIGPRS